jgi:hypothetical protein
LWDFKVEFTEVKNLAKATIGIGFLMPPAKAGGNSKTQKILCTFFIDKVKGKIETDFQNF